MPSHPRASPAPEHGRGVGSIAGPAPPSPPGPSPGAVLTAGSLADDLDAPLLVALGFLQLALVAVGGVIGAADGSHHHGAGGLLADAGGLGGVGGAPLAHRPEPAQHPSAGWGHRRGTPEAQHARDVGQSPARGAAAHRGPGWGWQRMLRAQGGEEGAISSCPLADTQGKKGRQGMEREISTCGTRHPAHAALFGAVYAKQLEPVAGVARRGAARVSYHLR